MRTTVSIDDTLLAQATELTGLTDRGPLLRAALTALIERESAQRLARLGGSDPAATAAPRRQSTL